MLDSLFLILKLLLLNSISFDLSESPLPFLNIEDEYFFSESFTDLLKKIKYKLKDLNYEINKYIQ